MKRIPCLVVSGFLGCGKTTLVRRLLAAAQAEGARAGFVSNEFGALGVDRALLGGGSDMVEIAGGCVCCALNDELYQTLLRLRAGSDPDRVVIETSGVAVPSDVQLTFYQPPIRDWVSEEAVVTVVGADQLLAGAELDGVFDEQVQTADIVVLNKVDLVPPGSIRMLERAIQARNPGVPVVPAVHCDLDLRLLYSGRSTAGPLPPPAASHLHESFESVEFSVPHDLDSAGVERLVRAQGAYRVKGFVHIDGDPYVVQGVGRRLEILPVTEQIEPSVVGRLVLIRRVGVVASPRHGHFTG